MRSRGRWGWKEEADDEWVVGGRGKGDVDGRVVFVKAERRERRESGGCGGGL